MAGNRVGEGVNNLWHAEGIRNRGKGGYGRSGRLEMAAPGKRFCETDMQDDVLAGETDIGRTRGAAHV